MSAQTTTPAPSIEARLAALESAESVREHLAAYAHACDTNDADAVASLFEPAGRLVIPGGVVTGRDAIASWYRERLIEPTKHYVTNVRLRHDATTGHIASRSEFLAVHVRDDGPSITWGSYVDVVTVIRRAPVVRRAIDRDRRTQPGDRSYSRCEDCVVSARLSGRVAVITGGASGIGEATVRRFLAEGARVVIADRQADRGAALATEFGADAVFVQTDVTDEAAVAGAIDAATARYGRLDVMFNNAGIIGVTGPIATIDADAYRHTMAVLLDSVVFGMKHAARVMLHQGEGGAIISTSSVAAVAGGLGAHTYSAAKAAVIGLTQSVAAELWPHRIRVNAVLPGKIMTPMTAEIRARRAGNTGAPPPTDTPEQMRADRRAYPDDIAAAVLFLVSDEGRFVTGESLLVDGGLVRAGGPSPFAIGQYSEPGDVRSGRVMSTDPRTDTPLLLTDELSVVVRRRTRGP